MMDIKRILFPTDFSPCADQAFTHALYLAKQYQAELHVLHGIVLHPYTDSNPELGFSHIDALHRQMEEAATSRMNSMYEAKATEQLKLYKIQQRGLSAGPIILAYAEAYDVDLIIMGTHGRRGLGYLFLGSVAEEVVRRAGCPVLTIRERKDAYSIENLDSILVPVDFSEHSRRALRDAKQIAASFDSRIELLYVIEQSDHPSFFEAEHSWLSDALDELRHKAKIELLKLYEETPGPLTSAEFHVSEGRAAKVILDFATNKPCDLIVIATHGLSGIDRLLMGNIAEKVVRRAPCPVFTVKAFGKSLTGEKNETQTSGPTLAA